MVVKVEKVFYLVILQIIVDGLCNGSGLIYTTQDGETPLRSVGRKKAKPAVCRGWSPSKQLECAECQREGVVRVELAGIRAVNHVRRCSVLEVHIGSGEESVDDAQGDGHIEVQSAYGWG